MCSGNFIARILLATVIGQIVVAAHAALPVEREVERESSLVATGVYDRRPAGSIEYSKNGVSRRHFGPWVYDTDRTAGAGETIFLEDGSVIRRGRESDFHWNPDGSRRCETVGNVTVCKIGPSDQ